MARRPLLIAALVMLALDLSSATARADDCPAGSRMKTEDGFSWCEPSVCQNDGNCSPSEVCRPVPLCVQIGKLDEHAATKDAAQRLVATQRCAPDNTCPATTTCSDMTRCVPKTSAAAASAPTAPASTSADPKKSSCGCTVAGEPADARWGLAALSMIALAIGSRTIQRRSIRAAGARRGDPHNPA